MRNLIDMGGWLVDRDRALKELHPSLREVSRELPTHPDQVAFRELWEATDHKAIERTGVNYRGCVRDAEEFIAEMRRRRVPDKDGRRPDDVIDAQVAAYAKRRARRTNPGPQSSERAA